SKVLSINGGFPALTRPPQHNRGDRTVTYRSEQVCARFVPSPQASTRILKIAAPRRTFEFRAETKNVEIWISGCRARYRSPSGPYRSSSNRPVTSPSRHSSRTADLRQRI